MDDDGYISAFLIGVIISGFFFWGVTRSVYKEEACRHGYAIYHPVDGKWMWMDDYVKSTNKVTEVEKEK